MDVPYIVFILFLLLLSGLYWKNPKRTYFVIAIWVVLFFIGFRSRVVGGADSINYVRFFTGEQNFYNINDEMDLVDRPGYGYARVSEKEKEQWGRMIERYLHSSKQLKAVFLLIDIRHAPSANDKMMYDWIVYQGYEPIIIATKMDKLKRSQISKHVKLVREGLGLKKESIVIPFSATSKQGREEIWNLMDSILESEVSENEDE